MEADFSHVWQMWVVFGAIIAAIAAYASEDIPLEVTSLALVAGLLAFFHFFPVEAGSGNLLNPENLLAGFADPALIAVLALLVVGQGLFQSGALEDVAQLTNANAIRAPYLTLGVMLVVVLVVSGFMNNTPVAVIFIPVVSALAAKASISSSKMMIPLSYASILGGMTTLIGSSTNLLASGAASRAGLDRIGFFDFTIPGVFLAAIGIVYVAFILPRLMPARANLTEEMGGSGKQFIAQLQLGYGHPLVGSKATGGMFPSLKNITVRMVQRGERPFLPPFEDMVLRPGDTLIIAATRATLMEALKQEPDIFQGLIHQDGGPSDPDSDDEQRPVRDLMLAETIVAPGSRMIGRNIEQAGFRMETDCIVLGVQRRSRMIRTQMSDIRLEAGDVLLIVGNRQSVRGLRTSRDLLLLEWSATEIPHLSNARTAQIILGGTVVSAALGIVPISIAAVAGALAMILTGCLNIRQASRAIDRQIFLLVGAALALGTSLEATGGATFLAQQVILVFDGFGAAVVLSVFFLLTAILTNVLSNNATAVLFVPIAVSTASQLGIDPMVFVYAVIFAANCSFATPMGYQTNLLVMGPGHYRFSDFMRAGAPLVIILWLAFSLFAPWYYGF
ncbi:TRAP transporter large permease subunit [Pyruvatibacter mobilis]|uniref:TRAP transporter large permease subunit n=1 Tax=Pyruvatibacter mobilis TaxID=1712261 RepID=A0A845QCB5_9HYPH|nr:SLC13 family permease [Pyruvatibacter mobilis]NBG95810.1 TRAP transporter large permease subunit [Pyruvatibacter mobilis]QJD74951.1 SLC13 family permease [Pyruvatibacter mobilis]